MRNIVIAVVSLVAACLLLGTVAEARDVYVKGYCRKDGRCVAPHYRTAPNHTVRDNYSYRGNVNPYTGEVGQDSGGDNRSGGSYYRSPTTIGPQVLTPPVLAVPVSPPIVVEQGDGPEQKTARSPCILIPRNFPNWASDPIKADFMWENCFEKPPVQVEPEETQVAKPSRPRRF